MPRLRNCIAPGPTGGPVTGFALIRLVAPAQSNGYPYPIFDVAGGKYIAFDETVEAHIDPNTGCWTSSVLPCNSGLTPAGTYYEIVEYVNGAVLDAHIVQFDCVTNAYPDPVNLVDVQLTVPPVGPTSLWCPIVQGCETPLKLVAGAGVAILAGDNPTGGAGNGHRPTVAAKLAAAAGNVLHYDTADNGLMLSATDVHDAVAPLLPTTRTRLAQLDDVSIMSPAAGDVLRRNAAGRFTNVPGGSLYETAGALAGHLADPDPHSMYTTTAEVNALIAATPAGAAVALSTVVANGDLIVGVGPGNVTRVPVGANGWRLTADATAPGGVKWAAESVSSQIASRTGTLTVQSAGQSIPRFYNDGTQTLTITQIRYAVDTVATGSNVTVVIRKNGVVTPVDVGTIPANANSAFSTGLSITLAPGEYLQAWVTGVGSSAPGADLSVTIKATRV